MKQVNLVNYIYCDNIYVKSLAHPVGLITMQQIINKNSKNIQINVIDPNIELYYENMSAEDIINGNFDYLVNYILKNSPEVVGFSTIADTFDVTVRLAMAVREKSSTVKIIMGGPQASALARDIMETCSFVDMVFIGEGEIWMLPALEYLVGEGDESNLANVVYRKNGEIITSKIKNDFVELDSLPIVEYGNGKEYDMIELEIGRGCPYNCYFCSTNRFWKQHFRIKSVDRMINEIKYYIDKFGNSKTFSFTHDLFTLNRDYVMCLCERIEKEKLEFRWGCSARADTLDEEMLKVMKKAGCRAIFIGVESGSPRMQKIMRKNLNLEHLMGILDVLKRIGLQSRLSFIYDFPEETQEDFDMTLDLIKKIKDKYGFTSMLGRCTFYPQTDLFEKYFDEVDSKNYFPKNRLCTQDMQFIINNKKLFSAYFTYRGVDYYGNIESFINYYLNILYFYFEATIRKLMQSFKSLVDMYEFLREFTDKESDELLHDEVVMSNKEGVMRMCRDFGKYIKEKSNGAYDAEIEFDMMFLENKLSVRK